jgi:tRNA nucleotidyltransferase/poly(A) polymerase
LKDVSKARVLEDFFKFFYTGHAVNSWKAFSDTNILNDFSPALNQLMDVYKNKNHAKLLIDKLLSIMDHNYKKRFKPLSYSLFLSVLLYPLIIEKAGHIKKISTNDLPKYLSEISQDLGCILLTKNIYYEMIDTYISITRIMSRNSKACKKLVKNGKLELGIEMLNIIEYSRAFNVSSALSWSKKLLKNGIDEEILATE